MNDSMNEFAPTPNEILSIDGVNASVDITVSNRFKNLVQKKARAVARMVTKRTTLTAVSLALLVSSGCANVNNMPIPSEFIPASASQGDETRTPEELPEGVCALEDKGNGVFELKSGTKSPIENSYNQEFLDVLKTLGYTNDDPRVVFIENDKSVGKGYAIAPDLLLTVAHVASRERSVYGGGTPSVNISHYGNKLALDYSRRDETEVSVLSDAWRNSSEGLKHSQDAHYKYDEGLTYVSFRIGNEAVNKPFTTGTPVATIKGLDIALIKLDKPLPNIKGTVKFKDSYVEGTEITIRRTPSKKLFIHGVVNSDNRFATANFQTYDKAEAKRFLEDLPGKGTSGSAVLDQDGNIIAALSRGHPGMSTALRDEGILYMVRDSVSSGASPSEIIGMVKDYCASPQNH